LCCLMSFGLSGLEVLVPPLSVCCARLNQLSLVLCSSGFLCSTLFLCASVFVFCLSDCSMVGASWVLLSVCVLSLFVILGRDVRVRMNNLATTGAWENYYLVVVAVQGPPGRFTHLVSTEQGKVTGSSGIA
jgi:hypothetical protein